MPLPRLLGNGFLELAVSLVEEAVHQSVWQKQIKILLSFSRWWLFKLSLVFWWEINHICTLLLLSHIHFNSWVLKWNLYSILYIYVVCWVKCTSFLLLLMWSCFCFSALNPLVYTLQCAMDDWYVITEAWLLICLRWFCLEVYLICEKHYCPPTLNTFHWHVRNIPQKLFLLLFNLDNRTGDFHRKQNRVNMVKALFGYTCIHLNPCVLEWIGVELCLISTTIHSHTRGLRWIRVHPNKP